MNTFIADAAERSRPYRIVGVAAVLMAAVAVGAMFMANAWNRPQPTRGLPVGATTSSSASTALSQAPSLALSAPAAPATVANLETFTCGASTVFTGKQPPLSAFIDGVRTGTHTGYDRFTIEFQNGQPESIRVQPQTGTTVTRDGKGDTVKLAGKDGLLISIFSTDAHTAYSGTTDIKTGFIGLLEARQVGDYEGYVHWALGLAKPACYHAVILTNPTRLVIDIQTS